MRHPFIHGFVMKLIGMLCPACQEGKRLVVIGSSFIGMELVVAVAKRKLASIDVVSMDKVPFERVLGEEVGKGLQQYHEGQGVKFHLSAKIEKLIPSEADSSAVGGVVVDGQTIPADVVIMGVGVAPATEFLKKSGLKLEKDGGVLVDEFLKVKGRENIYAIGDIAVFPQIKSGEPVRIEHWNVSIPNSITAARWVLTGRVCSGRRQSWPSSW